MHICAMVKTCYVGPGHGSVCRIPFMTIPSNRSQRKVSPWHKWDASMLIYGPFGGKGGVGKPQLCACLLDGSLERELPTENAPKPRPSSTRSGSGGKV